MFSQHASKNVTQVLCVPTRNDIFPPKADRQLVNILSSELVVHHYSKEEMQKDYMQKKKEDNKQPYPPPPPKNSWKPLQLAVEKKIRPGIPQDRKSSLGEELQWESSK